MNLELDRLLRILILNDYATQTGGAEIAAMILREGLRRRGYDARLFSSTAGLDANHGSADHVCAGTLRAPRILLQTLNPSAHARLRKTLKRFKPDVVHVMLFLTQLSPLILPLLRQVPSLCHAVWYRLICPLGTKMLPQGDACTYTAGTACHVKGCIPVRDWVPAMLQMHLWRRWSSAFDMFVTISEHMKQKLSLEGIPITDVIPLGVQAAPARPLLPGSPVAAFAGRLVQEKGVEILLRAFARVHRVIPSASLIIAGDGPEKERLFRLSRELGLSSHAFFLGHISRHELERSFTSAWVQVVPSQWDEPFGLVAAEAMMRGTAVVASDSGALPQIVQHGKTGMLTPPGDVASLERALCALLGNRELAETMGAAGRKAAIEKFGDSAYVESFVRVYEKLLRHEKKGSRVKGKGFLTG